MELTDHRLESSPWRPSFHMPCAVAPQQRGPLDETEGTSWTPHPAWPSPAPCLAKLAPPAPNWLSCNPAGHPSFLLFSHFGYFVQDKLNLIPFLLTFWGPSSPCSFLKYLSISLFYPSSSPSFTLQTSFLLPSPLCHRPFPTSLLPAPLIGLIFQLSTCSLLFDYRNTPQDRHVMFTMTGPHRGLFCQVGSPHLGSGNPNVGEQHQKRRAAQDPGWLGR